jgi:ketosteroid isomerase-like protein
MRWMIVVLAGLPLFAADPADEIRAARRQSNDAIARKDLSAFASSLAEDFVMVRGSGVFVPTKAAYLETFRKDFADPQAVRFERLPDRVELSKAAPLAAEHGHWIGTRPNGAKAFGGTYLAMWRRTPAGWRIRSELFVVIDCYDEAACAAYRQ